MNSDLAISMMAGMFWTGMLICMPVLGLVMAVGLAISLLQAVTQVQEMSLTFVPKLLTASAALIFFGPWMLRTLSQFAARLWSHIPDLF